MYSRILTHRFPSESFFLLGPRQVGKSTLLAQLGASWSLNLLNPEIQLEYSKNPNLLYRNLRSKPFEAATPWILIDEIQRVPALLDVVQLLMQERPQMKFALSGSSARKLKRGAANLLGGRALMRTLYPLTQEELGTDFQWEGVLAYGSLPKIYSTWVDGNEALAQDFLKSYVVTYLNEEIKAEALVRNLQGFQNFLDVAAAQFCERVNFKNVERDCRVSYSTVRDYYSILEDTMIGFFLQPYLKSRRKRMSHAPKFYFFDNGVTRAIQGMHRSVVGPVEKGRLWEQWVIQEIVRINAYHQKEWNLSFWRTSHGAEVDLLIERGREILWAVEIQLGKVVSSADLTGLRSLREEFPAVPCVVVYGGEESRTLEFAQLMPVSEFLNQLRVDRR